MTSQSATSNPYPTSVRATVDTGGIPSKTVIVGNSAVTIADGADVTQGALADTAVTGDSGGSLSAKLRGVNKALANPLPANAYQGGTVVSSANPLNVTDAKVSGTWGYNAGTAGTLTLSGGKRVLRVTAIAQQAAASFTINGGDTITLPYGATDKVSSSIEIEPRGNLINPTIVFTATVAYFVEWVT